MENIFCWALKKSTALCSEYRDIDCQTEMSLSLSPHLHILESVDISSVMGAFAHFFHSVAFFFFFTSADHCFYLAHRAECARHISNYLLSG